jgi:3-phenylpropionate/trans-cinnamate dioxygenase ferredoxin component
LKRRIDRTAVADLIEIARLDAVAAGKAIVVHVNGIRVALFSLDGCLFAVHDACLRCGSSLAEGTLAESEVACPGCDWRYDVTNGRVNGIPALRIDTFRISTVGKRVMLADRPPTESAGPR